MKTYTIKPLKWSAIKDEYGVFAYYASKSILCQGDYVIDNRSDRRIYVADAPRRVAKSFKTLEEAKAYCQRVHEKLVAKLLMEVK